MKRRLAFAVERWDASGALFAWDLWNEIHPANAGNSAEAFDGFIRDVSTFVRDLEMERCGRTHPQTDEIRDARPFFDSEHGPVHTFKDHLQGPPAKSSRGF